MKSIVNKMKILFFAFVFLLAGCSNIFEPASKKDSDAALFYQAELELDDQNYSDAVVALDQLSTEGKALPRAKLLYASAYAGLCGVEFIPFFTTISEANLDNASLFEAFLTSWTGETPDVAQCDLAILKLQEIGATDDLRREALGNNEANLLAAILSIAKIGGYLNAKADVDVDGVADAGIDYCADLSTGGFSQSEMIEIGLGFGLFVENAEYLFGSGSSIDTALDAMELIIATDPDDAGPLVPLCGNGTGKCIVTSRSQMADWSQGEIDEFVDTYRDLNKLDGFGIGGVVCVGDACCP